MQIGETSRPGLNHSLALRERVAEGRVRGRLVLLERLQGAGPVSVDEPTKLMKSRYREVCLMIHQLRASASLSAHTQEGRRASGTR